MIAIERADYMFRRGRTAMLSIGPLEFFVNTADTGSVSFGFFLGGWWWGWVLEGPTPSSENVSA